MTSLATASGLAISGRLTATSIEVSAGELIGLIGPNGSGKTSMLHALAGIPPAVGKVDIDGCEPHQLRPEQRQSLLSFLPASHDIAWPITGRDFIELALPGTADWSLLRQRLELDALLGRRMDHLSTGERARIMICRALAPAAALLLLDEPIANLDPYWQQVLLEELRRRAISEGKSVVLALHDLRTALAWSDRIWLMAEGGLVADADPLTLRQSGAIERVFRIASEWPEAMPEDRRSSP